MTNAITRAREAVAAMKLYTKHKSYAMSEGGMQPGKGKELYEKLLTHDKECQGCG